jgi:hypothetical protein
MPKKKSPSMELVEKTSADIAAFNAVISILRSGLTLDYSLDASQEIQQICQREISLLNGRRKGAEGQLE